MKVPNYCVLLFSVCFYAHSLFAEGERECFELLKETQTIFVGTTSVRDDTEFWGKIVNKTSVSNLVNIVSTSVAHPDHWYPLTDETVLFFCDRENSPIIALTCLNLLDEDPSRGFVRQFSIFKASISNEVYIIGKRIATSPELVFDRFSGNGVRLLLRKPSTRANEILMSEEIVKVTALDKTVPKRFVFAATGGASKVETTVSADPAKGDVTEVPKLHNHAGESKVERYRKSKEQWEKQGHEEERKMKTGP